MMLGIKPRMIAPIIAPGTPPTPPLKAVPPMTTAVMDVNVRESPIWAFPELVNMVMAMPEKAAIKPEIT